MTISTDTTVDLFNVAKLTAWLLPVIPLLGVVLM